ncbi:hypothetical protein C5167_044322 [Papaver somniferum]|uniref:Uncharacterized protein n=1 Tax=Papaver somniferum TaxID=3469 RepID=A0A4Y7L870_PAPSO|nr:hypothetical protein C5167_044322 [Papaver somniferum]
MGDARLFPLCERLPGVGFNGYPLLFLCHVKCYARLVSLGKKEEAVCETSEMQSVICSQGPILPEFQEMIKLLIVNNPVNKDVASTWNWQFGSGA